MSTKKAIANRSTPKIASLISHSRERGPSLPARLIGLSDGAGSRRIRDGRTTSMVALGGFGWLNTRATLERTGYHPVSDVRP